ncbi:MAG: efflux RND transporter periplasmic adaptor subunit [Alphaproteobacteria bacterium]|nr:efflux RND transporter periplasmic adaptor subunit [Alphaproteobacteria bacterium]
MHLMLRSFIAVLVVLAAAAGGGWAYWTYVMVPQQQGAAGPGRGGPPAGFAMPVEAAPVTIATAQRQIQAIGTLRSNESVVIRPEIAGRVAGFNFAEGQRVQRGQVLVQFDASVERAELAQAEAAASLARSNYQRAVELERRGAGTQRALDEAQAQIRTATAAIELRKARLEKFQLTAPFDGVVGLRKVSVGDFVNSGQEIVNLEQIDTLKVDFRVPELFLPALKTGQRVEIAVDAHAGRGFAGELYAIDPAVDVAGRAVVIRARIANADEALRPGLFARVTLTLAERPQALFVPEQAIIPQGDRHTLFKVVDNGDGKPKTVKLTTVKLGERRPGAVEILEGLARDDVVVTAGVLKIRDGMPVQVMPAGGPPQGAQPQGSSPAGAPGQPQRPPQAAAPNGRSG